MTETAFKKLFTQFLNQYWGAFHEALEAQSVTPRRLAGPLFNALETEHRAFETMYVGPAKHALDGLANIWRHVQARRYQWPDPHFQVVNLAPPIAETVRRLHQDESLESIVIYR